MSNKDELIAALEDEVRAARETIKSLTKIVEDLAKRGGNTTVIKTVQPYPYWWNGHTWYYTTNTNQLSNITYTNTWSGTSLTFNRDDDDDDGITVSNVA